MLLHLELGRFGVMLAFRWYDPTRDEVRTVGRVWWAPGKNWLLFGVR